MPKQPLSKLQAQGGRVLDVQRLPADHAGKPGHLA